MHSKRGLIFAILAAALALALLIGWLARPEPVPVRVEAVARGPVQATVANTRAGTIEACRRAGISPRLGGQIDLMPVSEGDVVEKDQILMAFWNDDLRARVRLAESELQASGARSEQACIVADRAAREAARQQRLSTQGLASEEAIDNAESRALAQQAACTAARAAVEVSQAQLEVARAALDQTQLRAPFPGVIAEVNGEVGEFVTPSPVGIPTPPAVDLMDISCLYVSAPIDEVDAPAIRVGMPANISLDAFGDQRFRGRVRRVAPYVLDLEKQARTVDVEVEFLEAADCDCMLPGYSADIEVVLARKDNALRVPTQAVREGNRVYLVNDEGRIEERHLEVGLRNWVWTEVTAGLVAGATLVLTVDREGVTPGALVEARRHERSDD
ncbi:efflux RND transporter periplasmic adaptor subunit [Pseudohaliea rubra]|uniref:Putative Co/Zn/Cd efflux system membrane fusion protein n=1 Tax=Pseudohaliea rubra DSM 19751 TaxID=1265313 RepID=A0A095X1A6_9GAMM|nr:efflux RND transporter periplasmic adaptor subunit [Pseudohaliea rubra]KGE04639.1 putative Co/Zn/Cd efflux system membrane fusion protein [Pseudohaliea rubra DSM 19751]